MDSLFHFFFTFSLSSIITLVESYSYLAIDEHGGRRSIAGIKESFKGNAARARLARGFRNKKISREIFCKKFKIHLQFYVKISNKNFSSFFTGKSLYNFFQKITFETIFQKVTAVV